LILAAGVVRVGQAPLDSIVGPSSVAHPASDHVLASGAMVAFLLSG